MSVLISELIINLRLLLHVTRLANTDPASHGQVLMPISVATEPTREEKLAAANGATWPGA